MSRSNDHIPVVNCAINDPGSPDSDQQSDESLFNESESGSFLKFEETTYKRRWWILFVYCFCAMSQGHCWNSWTPLADATQLAYDWSVSYVAIVPACSNIATVLLCYPLMYVVQSKGLRTGMVIAVTSLVAGAVAWLIGLGAKQYWLIAVGSFFNGITACVTIVSGALLSVLWFPVSERTKATAFASISSCMGLGLPFLTGPYISGSRTTAQDVAARNKTAVELSDLRSGLERMVYFDSGLSALCFIMVLAYFPLKPPKPPSRSQTIKRVDFWQGLKTLGKNSQYWMLSIAFGLTNGVMNTWLPLCAVNFRSLGIDQMTAGWIGFAAMAASTVGSIALSAVADKFKRKSKLVLKIMMVLSIVFYSILGLIQYEVITVPERYTTGVLLTLCVAAAICVTGAIPLYFELSCEYAYPVHEGLACTTIIMLSMLSGVIYYLFYLIPSIAHNPQVMTWVNVGICSCSLPLLFLLKDSYNRLDAETQPVST